MSGSMWQGMETRQGDGTEALSQETESNGSATPKSRRHPLTLPPDRLRLGDAAAISSRRRLIWACFSAEGSMIKCTAKRFLNTKDTKFTKVNQ